MATFTSFWQSVGAVCHGARFQFDSNVNGGAGDNDPPGTQIFETLAFVFVLAQYPIPATFQAWTNPLVAAHLDLLPNDLRAVLTDFHDNSPAARHQATFDQAQGFVYAALTSALNPVYPAFVRFQTEVSIADPFRASKLLAWLRLQFLSEVQANASLIRDSLYAHVTAYPSGCDRQSWEQYMAEFQANLELLLYTRNGLESGRAMVDNLFQRMLDSDPRPRVLNVVTSHIELLPVFNMHTFSRMVLHVIPATSTAYVNYAGPASSGRVRQEVQRVTGFPPRRPLPPGRSLPAVDPPPPPPPPRSTRRGRRGDDKRQPRPAASANASAATEGACAQSPAPLFEVFMATGASSSSAPVDVASSGASSTSDDEPSAPKRAPRPPRASKDRVVVPRGVSFLFSANLLLLGILVSLLFPFGAGATAITGQSVLAGATAAVSVICAGAVAWKLESGTSLDFPQVPPLNRLSIGFGILLLGVGILCCALPSSASSVPLLTESKSMLAPRRHRGCTASLFGSPHLSDVLESAHSAALLATRAETQSFSMTLCIDSGANRHISNDLHHFRTYKPCNISITVAKKGMTMTAVGVGDCAYPVMDSDGNPHTLVLKDVLHVPDAGKCLVSVSELCKDGYQCVLPSSNPVYPPGLYSTRKTVDGRNKSLPFENVGSLFYIRTFDASEVPAEFGSRNSWIVYHRKLGFMPLDTLRNTISCSVGLDDLLKSPMPRNYVSAAVRLGKSVHIDRPKFRNHRTSRPFACVYMDTFQTKTKSLNGHMYCSVFVDDHSGFIWTYTHSSTSQVFAIFQKWYADTAPLRDRHGPLLAFRRDNASVNVSHAFEAFLVQHNIRSETTTPYESWSNGHAERAIRTIVQTARTNMIASGLVGRFWSQAVFYSTDLHNVQYSAQTKTSPHVLMFGEKPDLSSWQPFGVECWIHLRPDQRTESKFGARGEPAIYVGNGTSQNRKCFVVWAFKRGPSTLVSTTNLVFGDRCPHAPQPSVPHIVGDVDDLPLRECPPLLQFAELDHARQPVVVGRFQDQLVFALASDCLRVLPQSALLDCLTYTLQNGLASAHLSIVDSLEFVSNPPVAATAVSAGGAAIPRTLDEAMTCSPEWKAAVETEAAGLLSQKCFLPVRLPPHATVLPGIWLFDRKRDGRAKARFVIGGHRQVEGRDFYEYKNYASVLHCRDNRTLLSVAASEGWQVYQSDIQQAFLEGQLDDVDIYIKPIPGIPCPPGHVLKLQKAVYGLRQAPVKFKHELVSFFYSQGYTAVNASETVFIKRTSRGVLVHATYVDDCLHFTDNAELYREFRLSFEKRFKLKIGMADNYLGNQLKIDPSRQTVSLSQEAYIDSLLARFDLQPCTGVTTPIVTRLSKSEMGAPLTPEAHAQYRAIVGSLLYVAVWSRPDISYAVSELSRFVSAPGEVHLQAAKHLLRYLKATKSLPLTYSRQVPTSGNPASANVLTGYVDSDWAGCPDSRKSTSGYALLLNGAAISWKSKRQSVVALSTAEAEFIAASSLVQEVTYVRRFLHDLGFPQSLPTPVYEDNTTCIAWSEGSVGGTDQAKHIDLRRHFVHQAVQDQLLVLLPVRTTDNAADLFTKPQAKDSLVFFRKILMGF